MKISSGIFGFVTMGQDESKADYKASFLLEADRPNWKKVDEILGGEILDIITGLFKVNIGLTLPKNAAITFKEKNRDCAKAIPVSRSIFSISGLNVARIWNGRSSQLFKSAVFLLSPVPLKNY